MLIRILIICSLCLGGCAGKHFEPFNTRDYQLQTAYSVITVVDWMQTREFEAQNHVEANPLLGKHPSKERIDTLIPLAMVGHGLFTWWLPSDKRKYWQLLWIGIETGAVVHNYSVGVRMDF